MWGPPRDSQRKVTLGSKAIPVPTQVLPQLHHRHLSYLCLPLPTVPPRFVNKVRATPFVEGEDAQITCTVEGAPYPQIR